MSYTVAACVAVGAVVLLDLAVLGTRLLGRRIFWTAYGIVLLFQLIVNGVLTGRGVVRYDAGAIIGVRFVHAPVEDLFFGFALVTATLVLWVWAGRRGVDRRGSEHRSSASGGGAQRPRKSTREDRGEGAGRTRRDP